MSRWIIQRPQEHSHPAEIRVAEQLRELDDHWTVIWGFYYIDKQRTEREGDFLIIGPAGGMLVLEVKSSLPRWYISSGSRGGEKDSPINQLMAEWQAVVGIVKEEGLPTWVAKALCVPSEEASVDQGMVEGFSGSGSESRYSVGSGTPEIRNASRRSTQVPHFPQWMSPPL